jgi:NADH-quinone oxidoreductase subunit H
MNSALFQFLNITIIAFVVWLIPLQFIPFLIWLERKGSAFIQDRVGPDRTDVLGFRLFGYIQNFADVVKLLMKEDVIPLQANRFYFLLAPFWSMMFSLIPLMSIPLAGSIHWINTTIHFQVVNLNVGLLFFFSITSMGILGIVLAGWASNNKFSLIGGLRSSAQMISYELSMAMSLITLLVVYQHADFQTIVHEQTGLYHFFGYTMCLPNWGFFLQPIAFLIFLVASFAETNRNPFDLPEGESELVAGYHVEYSSIKFALFFMSEYANMVVVSFLNVSLFWGGYEVPYVSTAQLIQSPRIVLLVLSGIIFIMGLLVFVVLFRHGWKQRTLYNGVKKWEPFLLGTGMAFIGLIFLILIPFWLHWNFPAWFPLALTALVQFGCLIIKVVFFCWLFVWVRWTLPRFRYDQLMNLGWKIMLPIAMLNFLVTSIFVILK